MLGILQKYNKWVVASVLLGIGALMAAVSFLSLSFYMLYIGILLLALLQLVTDASVEASLSSSNEGVMKRFGWKVVKGFPVAFVFMLIIINERPAEVPGGESQKFFLLGTIFVSGVFARLRKDPNKYQDPDPLRENQVRLAALLLAIALVFFATLFWVGSMFE
ncbi:hypothetical protein IMZ31_01200 [Pontibacillus sp. ALD_SL1]|uniref:hypothetical protein n=1 Tax=Pontibacillus sp. ALD_SL1 TaxID=2777185 RepID=UPI001A97C53C|nr:hypothetical protein [Pontibacillus sp. ALD_SL1]QST00264.1 hypothetical protein IMZ31_01200 [Pontibacillus sp. ALD_SL1]